MVRKEEGLDAGEVINDEDGRTGGKILAAMNLDTNVGKIFEQGDGATGSQIGTTVHYQFFSG
jgi:hypothetical protein